MRHRFCVKQKNRRKLSCITHSFGPAHYADDAVQKGMLSAQLSARMKVAAEKQAEVNRTFALAKQRLISLPDEERFEFLSKLLQEALSDNLGGELLLNAYDRKELGTRLVKHSNKISGEKVTLSDDTADIAGGLIVRAGVGRNKLRSG